MSLGNNRLVICEVCSSRSISVIGLITLWNREGVLWNNAEGVCRDLLFMVRNFILNAVQNHLKLLLLVNSLVELIESLIKLLLIHLLEYLRIRFCNILWTLIFVSDLLKFLVILGTHVIQLILMVQSKLLNSLIHQLNLHFDTWARSRNFIEAVTLLFLVLLDWWETTFVFENAVDCLKFGRFHARAAIFCHDGLFIPCFTGQRNWVLRWVLSSKTLFHLISLNWPFGALHTWTLLCVFRNHNWFRVLLTQTWILIAKVNLILQFLLLLLKHGLF